MLRVHRGNLDAWSARREGHDSLPSEPDVRAARLRRGTRISVPAAQDGVGVPRRTAIFDARNVLTSAETITAEFFAPAISAGVRLGSGGGGEVPGAARRAGIRILRELCIVEMVDVHVAQQNGMDVPAIVRPAS